MAMLKRRRELSPFEDENDGESPGPSSSKEEIPHIEPSENPLLNDLILSNLFEYMDYKDLKACRLVCKTWHILTIPFARTRFIVKINGDKSNRMTRLGEIRTMEQFMELIRSNTLGIEFWNFELAPFDPTVGVGQEFLSIFGNDMKSLELFLGACDPHTVEDIGVILRSTPNLEYFGMPMSMCSMQGKESVVKLSPPKLPFLKTFHTSEEPDGRRKNCPTFLEELFTAAENISSVYLYDHDCQYSRPGVILEVLLVLEKLGRESTLENLIISRVRTSHLMTLRRMASNGLKLKHLRILRGQVMPLHEPDPEPEPTWIHAIELFAETLVTLGVCYNGSRQFELPRMPKLKNLDVHIPANGNLRCERNNFINTFPALERLSMICEGGRFIWPRARPIGLHQFFNGNDICQNMKILSLREGFNMTTNQSLERALKIFPNLYELELNIESAELLQHIWVHMSGLEKLHLYGTLKNDKIENIDMDSIFIGIPPHEIKKNGNCKEPFQSLPLMSLEKRRETLQSLVERHQTLTSVSNLTSLRFLSLSIPEGLACDGRESTYMSDLTGYLGLYFLKNLQELRLWNCGFSKSCIKILIDDIGLKSWNFKHRIWEEIEDRVRSDKKPYNGIHRRRSLEFCHTCSFGN